MAILQEEIFLATCITVMMNAKKKLQRGCHMFTTLLHNLQCTAGNDQCSGNFRKTCSDWLISQNCIAGCE